MFAVVTRMLDLRALAGLAALASVALGCSPSRTHGQASGPAPPPAHRPAAPATSPPGPLRVELLGAYRTGLFDRGAAEVLAHDPARHRLYVVNGADGAIDVIDMRDPTVPVRIAVFPLGPGAGAVHSVATHGDRIVAVAAAPVAQSPGRLVCFDPDGQRLGEATVGANPDMVAITPDGAFAVVANEGEPSADYTVDPPGSVSIVDLGDFSVRTVGFESLDARPAPVGMHQAAPHGTLLSVDVEPEYVAISGDSRTAWVTLQEANAIAIIDLRAATLTDVVGLPRKGMAALPFDASDKDGGIHLVPWPVQLLLQPDAIAWFEHGGADYLVTANEGDARDYPGYSEEVRCADLRLDPGAFPHAAELQAPDKLGRLKVSRAVGDTDGDGDHDEVVAFGGRSLSIWTGAGELVWDSGVELETRMASLDPARFNSQGTVSSFDSRSDDKGSEPEGVAIGVVGGRRFAFIGLERTGGFYAYDVTNPRAPFFAAYAHSVVPDGDVRTDAAGDIAPEGLVFVAASASPTGEALLAVAYEVSGSVALYRLTLEPAGP